MKNLIILIVILLNGVVGYFAYQTYTATDEESSLVVSESREEEGRLNAVENSNEVASVGSPEAPTDQISATPSRDAEVGEPAANITPTEEQTTAAQDDASTSSQGNVAAGGDIANCGSEPASFRKMTDLNQRIQAASTEPVFTCLGSSISNECQAASVSFVDGSELQVSAIDGSCHVTFAAAPIACEISAVWETGTGGSSSFASALAQDRGAAAYQLSIFSSMLIYSGEAAAAPFCQVL